jgi:hypothetical protein
MTAGEHPTKNDRQIVANPDPCSKACACWWKRKDIRSLAHRRHPEGFHRNDARRRRRGAGQHDDGHGKGKLDLR